MSKWPKTIPPLSPDQQAISDDFMRYWHEVLPKKFSIADSFGHRYVVRTAPRQFETTLEIGAGLGEHLAYEHLSDAQAGGYYALDLRENMVEGLRKSQPHINAIVGDCQLQQPFADGYFDRIVAIHVLEHLPNLPAAVREMHRLCNQDRGMLQMIIPCEGSLAYGIARRISAKRIFEKRYRQSYDWFIKREHINLPDEILEELRPFFSICSRTYFPLPVPLVACNLFIGCNLRPRSVGCAEDRRSLAATVQAQ